MTTPTRIFIHGLESSSQGTKGVYFKAAYPDMIVEDFPGTFDERMTKLNVLLAGTDDLVIVGSSYGGLMAAVYACENESRVRKVILLAPALNLDEFVPFRKRTVDIPVVVYHGKRDDVVPVDEVKAIATSVFTNLDYHIIDDDHPLHDKFETLDWTSLLAI